MNNQQKRWAPQIPPFFEMNINKCNLGVFRSEECGDVLSPVGVGWPNVMLDIKGADVLLINIWCFTKANERAVRQHSNVIWWGEINVLINLRFLLHRRELHQISSSAAARLLDHAAWKDDRQVNASGKITGGRRCPPNGLRVPYKASHRRHQHILLSARHICDQHTRWQQMRDNSKAKSYSNCILYRKNIFYAVLEDALFTI